MAVQYKLVRGTKDFLSSGAFTIAALENTSRKLFSLYGYQEVRLPLIENIGIFKKGLGNDTDIVERQIFSIEGKAGICLRPEATAQMVRAYIENGLKNQKLFKAFYIGPMFRGERPQKGRLRQFHHIGCEAIGVKSVFLDVEIISLASRLIRSLGVKRFSLEINSLGCKKDRDNLKRLLNQHLKDNYKDLCKSCQVRVDKNILRVLDCKRPKCAKIVKDLNIGHKYLCEQCRLYLDELCFLLDKQRIIYKINPTLVRGLDYYTDIVFEFVSDDLGAQSAIGAGGRYDDLVESLGGFSKPASGFALGLERLMLLRDDLQPCGPVAFIACVSDNLYKKAFDLLNLLRYNNISCDIDFGQGSLKSQLRYCQKLKCRYAVILGDEELAKESVILRDMGASSQKVVKIDELIELIKEDSQSCNKHL